MSDYAKPSMATDVSSTQRHAPNFSRPRPQSSSTVKKESSDPVNVHQLNAFYEPNRSLMDKSRFSSDSDHTEQKSGSDVAWDGQSGELSAIRRKKQFDRQRYTRSSARTSEARPTTSTSAGSASTARTFNLDTSSADDRSSSASGPSSRGPKITDRVSVDQQSERASTSTSDQFEDGASHHTVSEDGGSGSFDEEGRWQSSEYDTSELTDAEIRKLQKKGINPSLYMEMKAARKGKKWVGPLFGNTFLG